MSSLSFPDRSPRLNWLLAIAAAVLSLGEALRFRSIVRIWNPDLLDYTAWYEYILVHGRWHALNGNFASYNPPYIYVLALVSNLSFWHGPNTMVKFANLPFLLLAAGLTYGITRKLGCSPLRSLLGAWLVFVAPEVIANALVWGQTDMFETSFLLLMLLLLLRGMPFWAMVAGGVALSFKLQAIFVGPAVLALLFTGELPWLALLGIPAGYALMLLPAELEGRPLTHAFGAYAGQMQVPEKISMGAPNVYRFLLPLTGKTGVGPRVWWIEHIGIASAALITVALILFFVRQRPLLRGNRLLLVLAITALLEPFVLPKMHERYFYIGDTFALVAGVLRPRLFLAAAMLQIAAVLSYSPFLIGFHVTALFYILPFLLLLGALLMLFRELRRDDVATAEVTSTENDTATPPLTPASSGRRGLVTRDSRVG